MAGTGNLILKRGSGIPSDEQNSGTLALLQGMPAVQIVGLSRPSNSNASTIGEYAFDNYPNRLWIGFDGYGTLAESVGGVGGAGPGAYSSTPPNDATKRPIWMGAEIRADAAVYRTGTSSALNDVPAVFRADWTNAVDTVLVTQKAIKTYVDAQVGGKGSMSSFNVSADIFGDPTSSIGNNDTLSILGSTGLTTQYTNTTLAINLDFAEISTVTPSSATGTYLVGTSGVANQKYTIGNVLAKMSGDVTASTSGITTVNSVSISAVSSGTTYYPVFVTGSGTTKTLYVDAAVTTLEYVLSTSTLKAENIAFASGGTIKSGTSTMLSKTALTLYGSTSGSVTINTVAAPTAHTLTLPTNNASGVLQNDGSGVLSWVSGVPASTANDLTAGAAGSLPYQVGIGDTSFLSIGTVNQILSVNSGTTAPQWTSTLSGIGFSTSATVTAGTNAISQGAITSDYNVITTTSSNPSGVTLPSATIGRRIIIVNKGTNAINVYPASGGTIDGLALNASIQIPVNGVMFFNASSTTQWYSSGNSIFTAPTLGTPSSGTLTNCTGLPATGITGILSGANGGTGVVNTGKTITLGGNLTTAGAYTTTLTANADTSITLPTTGTLATLAGTEILTNKTIDTIAASGASAATAIHGAVTTGSITIGSGITSGSINIGNGTAITTGVINIGGGAITSGTKAITIGTGAGNGTSTTTITIGGGNGTTNTTCNVSIGCPSAVTSNVYIANNKLTLGSSVSADRIIITGDTTLNASTRTHTFPNKASGNVVIVSGGESAGQVLIAGGGTTAAHWGNAPASSPVLYEINGGTTNTVSLGLSTFDGDVDAPGAAFAGGKILLPDPNIDIQGNNAATGYLLAVHSVDLPGEANTIVHLTWKPGTLFVTKSEIGLTSDSNVALLGADGATKGKQTFLSPIGVESYVEILPYNIGATQYPATITSALEGAASIFDTNIIDLSMGGAAELIEIGDGSTGGNTATTIYGQLTVTGSTILSADTMIDGGTF